MAAPRWGDFRVPSAAFWGWWVRLVKERAPTWREPSPKQRRRFVALLTRGHDGKSLLFLVGLFGSLSASPRWAENQGSSEGIKSPALLWCGPWAVGCLSVGWFCQCLKCMCLCLVRMPMWLLCQSVFPLGPGGCNLGSIISALLGVLWLVPIQWRKGISRDLVTHTAESCCAIIWVIPETLGLVSAFGFDFNSQNSACGMLGCQVCALKLMTAVWVSATHRQAVVPQSDNYRDRDAHQVLMKAFKAASVFRIMKKRFRR